MPGKRRRLSDLYVTGREVNINDDTGEDPVTVWVQKLNPVENDDALRRGSSHRARILSFKKDPDSEDYKRAEVDVHDFMNREQMVQAAIRDELEDWQTRIEAENAAEESWSKDDYLQGLVDLWEGTEDEPGLKETYAANPADPEAARVNGELERFNEQVLEQVEAKRVTLHADWAGASDDDLLAKAVSRLFEVRATNEFVAEYEVWQVYYATRQAEDHSKLYFRDADEVRRTAGEVREQIAGHYRNLSVDVVEGKDSAEIPASSPSSEPAEPAAVGASSSRVVAAV